MSIPNKGRGIPNQKEVAAMLREYNARNAAELAQPPAQRPAPGLPAHELRRAREETNQQMLAYARAAAELDRDERQRKAKARADVAGTLAATAIGLTCAFAFGAVGWVAFLIIIILTERSTHA